MVYPDNFTFTFLLFYWRTIKIIGLPQGYSMFVHYYMTENPVTISADSTVGRAEKLVSEHCFRHLPVVDEQLHLQGIITDRDIRSAWPSTILKPEERQKVFERVRNQPVKEIMSEAEFFLVQTTTLDDALLLFTTHPVGALPVVDGSNRLVGIFSVNDMMHAYRNLFGLGEKGSMLVAVQDNGEKGLFATLARELEQHNISCTRMVRTPGEQGHAPAAVYLRVNTCKMAQVRKIIEKAGFHLFAPTGQLPGGLQNA